MNWTVLISPQFISQKNKILNFFQTKNNQSFAFKIEKNVLDNPFFPEATGLMEAISKKLDVSDFFICLADENELICPVIMYALGYAQALSLPLYFIGENIKFSEQSQELFYYKTLDEFIEIIQKDYPSMKKRKKNTGAQRKICEMGLSFSIDGFSSAIQEKNKDLCELYFLSGIDLNGRDSLGTPLLNNAIRCENYDIVKQLLKHSVSINEKSQDRGYSPLMDAVWKSNFKIVKLLVEAGADLNHIADDGQSILILATGIDNYEICELLVKAGASAHIKDKMGMSALDYARLFKCEHLVTLYEKEGL